MMHSHGYRSYHGDVSKETGACYIILILLKISEPSDPVSPTTCQHSPPASLSSTHALFLHLIARNTFHRRAGRYVGVQGFQNVPVYASSYTRVSPHPILLTEQSDSFQLLSSSTPIPNRPIQNAGKDGGSLESSSWI